MGSKAPRTSADLKVFACRCGAKHQACAAVAFAFDKLQQERDMMQAQAQGRHESLEKVVDAERTIRRKQRVIGRLLNELRAVGGICRDCRHLKRRERGGYSCPKLGIGVVDDTFGCNWWEARW